MEAFSFGEYCILYTIVLKSLMATETAIECVECESFAANALKTVHKFMGHSKDM